MPFELIAKGSKTRGVPRSSVVATRYEDTPEGRARGVLALPPKAYRHMGKPNAVLLLLGTEDDAGQLALAGTDDDDGFSVRCKGEGIYEVALPHLAARLLPEGQVARLQSIPTSDRGLVIDLSAPEIVRPARRIMRRKAGKPEGLL